jgi:hypothetical protein
MTIFTHILLTTAGAQALGLHGTELVLAYGFGVAVDVDHLVKLPLYLKKNGLKNEKFYHWRTSLQEPISLLWILPLSIFLRTVVPVIFFIPHLLLDYLVSYEKRPLFPFHSVTTRGFLPNVSDGLKEIITVIILVCLNLFLFLIKR